MRPFSRRLLEQNEGVGDGEKRGEKEVTKMEEEPGRGERQAEKTLPRARQTRWVVLHQGQPSERARGAKAEAGKEGLRDSVVGRMG